MPLLLKDFSAKKKKAAFFEFVPKKRHSLDFEQILDRLRRHYVLITVETNEILVVRFLKAKITLFKSGILTVEKIKTAARAKKILQKFLEKIN
ncbi:MAG TPA: hypothetical protein VI977_03335 [archaeon]|nr:hypothetical protein [archaeon]